MASEKGHAGGRRLARPPGAVSLADICRALGGRVLAPVALAAPPGCAVEAAPHAAVDGALLEAEALLLGRLDPVSVADLAGAMDAG